MADFEPTPEPKGWPIVNHLIGVIDDENPTESFTTLGEQLGSIYRIRLMHLPVTFVSDYRMINELCDERRFRKVPGGVFKVLRDAANDGLITAYEDEENWGIAHRILMPAFGPAAIRGMFDDMYDIASQMIMKWARLGVNEALSPNDDFTRLAMDTLALCSMDYRFNSFYSREKHPFLQVMARTLLNSRPRARRLDHWAVNYFYQRETQQWHEDIAFLRKVSDDIVQHRNGNPSPRSDLIARMLNSKDPKTGKTMTDTSITDNMLSFLVAGHETTAGTLSFAVYFLILHPRVYQKARQDIDRVVQGGRVTVDHLQQLPYIEAILRETLRLRPTLPTWSVRPYKDEIIGGRYHVRKGESTVVLLRQAHRDKDVYGDDAEDFRPERMVDEHFNKLPHGAYKPFGNGKRACIGRNFALQEARLMLVMLLQNFDLELDDPSYILHTKQTLTIKPADFQIRANLRPGLTPGILQERLVSGGVVTPATREVGSKSTAVAAAVDLKPLTILYGSNAGTCANLAQILAAHAPSHGFNAVSVNCLDNAVDRLPKDHPVVFISTSYEGQPTDDAKSFFSWLNGLASSKSLDGVRYAVYGLGHHDWASTFHKVPRILDAGLEQAGGHRLLPLQLQDVGATEIFSTFELWEDESFWPMLEAEYGVSSSDHANQEDDNLDAKLRSLSTTILNDYMSDAVVVGSRVLTAPGEPVKTHLHIQLPDSASYEAGDYLLVLPRNPPATVERVLKQFGISQNAQPSLIEVIESCVELNRPASKRALTILQNSARSELSKTKLHEMASEQTSHVPSRASILDILESYPDINLSLTSFLTLLPPLSLRQYSISSSPLWKRADVTLTFSVLGTPSLPGEHGHIGVASSYLASLSPGDRVRVAVRSSHDSFRLPATTENKPVIMIGAGSGVAPFRAFIQQRAVLGGERGLNLPPAYLFHGCREPGMDDLYADELSSWQDQGIVRVRRAYSRTPDKAHGQKYVQDTLWAERAQIADLWQAGAKFFICGSQEMGHAVVQVLQKILSEAKLVDGEDVEQWWAALRNVRYAIDIFD